MRGVHNYMILGGWDCWLGVTAADPEHREPAAMPKPGGLAGAAVSSSRGEP